MRAMRRRKSSRGASLRLLLYHTLRLSSLKLLLPRFLLKSSRIDPPLPSQQQHHCQQLPIFPLITPAISTSLQHRPPPTSKPHPRQISRLLTHRLTSTGSSLPSIFPRTIPLLLWSNHPTLPSLYLSQISADPNPSSRTRPTSLLVHRRHPYRRSILQRNLVRSRVSPNRRWRRESSLMGFSTSYVFDPELLS
jgi:hypothetical protein